MTNKLYLYSLIVVTCFFSSCVTDLFEKEELTPPEVSITKVENNELNESILFFSVEEENDNISFIGVSIKTNEAPQTSEGQSLYEGTTGDLALNLGTLSADSLYYVKAYAGNESGFAESEIYQFIPSPPVAIEAPCSLNTEQIIEDNAPYNTYSTYASENSAGNMGEYGIETNYNSISGRRLLGFSFQDKPITGRYNNTSRDDFDQFSSDVYVHFLRSSGVFETGGYVYINVDSNDVATIEFCDLQYESLGTTHSLSGSFSTTLN